MLVIKKYSMIISLAFLFTACFDSLEKEKALCLKENKNYQIKDVMNYRTGKFEPRVICE